MKPNDIVLNCFTDNEKGIQQLITCFLNEVMKDEAPNRAGYRGTRGRVHGERKIGAYPDDASLIRLAGAIIIDIYERTGSRFFFHV